MKSLATKLIRFVFIFLFLITCINSYAIEVPQDKAKVVATNYLRHLTNQPLKRSGDLVKLVYTSKTSTTKRATSAPLFYVFNQVEGKGFIIVSGDDNIKPILGYSLESNFDQDNLSPQVAYWLSEYEKQISYVVESNVQNTLEKQQWEMISLNQFSRKRGTTAVKPLLKTTWDQGAFYNDSCPYDNTAKKRVPVGCVATAMAQTMKYWGYPSKGVSSTSYTHATYGLLKANFGNTTYNWSAMSNKVTAPNTEVARLMYHCGVALNMNYGPDGSGAWATYDTRYAKTANMHLSLIDYFQYDNTSISSIFKREFTDQAWQDKLKTELNQARVIVYCGNDGTGQSGHCFVFDGYDLNDFFHIDWGWSGSFNGYFNIASLVPNGTGTGGGSGNYSSNQEAVIGIRPKVSQVPSVAFSASSSFTSVGQVINFVDESTNYPYAWSWTISPNNATFVNGTTNTSKFPEVSFSSPGKYTITLTSTNSMGSNTVSKTSYITVNPALTKQVCDTLTNFLSTEKKTYVSIIGGGSLAGHIKNLNGFSEQYSVPTNYSHVSGALLDFKRAETNNSSSVIKVNVYQNNNGVPGTILSSKNVKISDIKNDIANGNQTKVVFDSPVAVTGIFYIGFETTNAPGDTVGLYTSSTSGVTTNTGFIKYISNNSWCSYSACWGGLKIHLNVSPMMAILPSANFTINSSPTQINTNVDIDASSSTDSYAYNWTLNGASISNSIYYKESITYATPGTYDIKLDAIGGCGNTTSITKQILVNGLCTSAPSTPGSISGINKICAGQTNVTYSIAPVNSATGYVWTLPNGFIGTSTSNTITLSAPNTQITGNIQVAATNSCGTSAQSSLSVSTILKSDPTFTQVNSICSGTVLTPLPTTSNNSIPGSWSPALDNLKTTEYTFTPSAGQCANLTKMTISIIQKVTPTFKQLGSYCKDANADLLPTTSTNGIVGSWNPITVSTSTLGSQIYTFTPTSIGLPTCASTTTMNIEIKSQTIPSFTQLGPYCKDAKVNILPTTSTNGITGTWSPILDNTKTTDYTFTPSQGQCALNTKMTIIVNDNPITGEIQNLTDFCIGKSINISSSISGGSWSSSNMNVAKIDQNGLITSISVGNTNIVYTTTEKNCSNTVSKQININDCASISNQSEMFVKVYPNPCQDVLNIAQESKVYSFYKIIDVVGKIIEVGKIVKSESVIKTDQLVSGQYLLRLETNEGELKYINFNKN